MIPLNIYLQEAFDAGGATQRHRPATAKAREQIERGVVEYGNAIKDLVAANIFPGDMLWKNFGITRHGKVVFYDYDEIEYITDCNFRKVPEPRNEEEEMSGEVWYSVGPKDVFPETFGPFLLGNPAVRADLHEAPRRPARRCVSGKPTRTACQAGHVLDVFPYDQDKRRFHRERIEPDVAQLLPFGSFSDSLTGDLAMTDSPSTHRDRGAARTPMGSFQGDLSSLAAHDLGGAAIKAAVERAGVAPEQVDEVLFGNCLMAGQGQAPARQAGFKGGLPISAGAVTLSKMCGSGMRAAMLAHDMLLAGSADVMVAGGMESMTNAPYLLPKARGGYRIGHDRMFDHMMLDGLEDAYEAGRSMGTFGEDCAAKYGFTREQQDAFAIASVHARQGRHRDRRVCGRDHAGDRQGPRRRHA